MTLGNPGGPSEAHSRICQTSTATPAEPGISQRISVASGPTYRNLERSIKFASSPVLATEGYANGVGGASWSSFAENRTELDSPTVIGQAEVLRGERGKLAATSPN